MLAIYSATSLFLGLAAAHSAVSSIHVDGTEYVICQIVFMAKSNCFKLSSP